MIRKLKKIEPQTVRLPSRHTIDNEFADHCATLVNDCCSLCGGNNLDHVDQRQNVGRCLTCNLNVPLAPSLETIYGAPDNHLSDRGTGEMRNGHMSATGKRREIFNKRPTSYGAPAPNHAPGIRYIDTSSLPGLPKDSAW